ncbi:MAG: NAD(P)-binding protein [Candidatus Rokuibacteriota bacterium]
MTGSVIGQQAVVIGAGMGGLTAARALADHFERVLVLERDVLPADPLDRHGVPQGRPPSTCARAATFKSSCSGPTAPR